MRIASLVPSATESLFALGLGEQVVAVTHECDSPAEALRLPRLTRSVIPKGLDPQEIDAMVREVTARGEPLYELDEEQLAAVAPDLIVTQALCAVCAVSFDDVSAVDGRMPSKPDVISLDIRLPGMNGLDATRRIMADHPTPIVVVSANVDADDFNISMNALSAERILKNGVRGRRSPLPTLVIQYPT